MSPYANEHACRLHPPSGYARFRRGTRQSNGKTYSVIWGIKSDGTTEEQAYRYNRQNWSAAQARTHCRNHDGQLFEPASGENMRSHCGVYSNSVALQLREEQFEGRAHLVAPVVALVEGVHQGSAGPVYYPPNEIGSIIAAWNGVPIPINHPSDNGQALSANDPKILEERCVGRFFNAEFDSNGAKLKGELWLDIERMERLAPEILADIQAGRPVEVSTAMWFDIDEAPGSWRGEQYIGTVSNFRPDHIALLPEEAGACSWADGCGVRVNKTHDDGGDNVEVNILSRARTPSFVGTETISWGDVPTTFEAYRNGYYRGRSRPAEVPAGVGDAPGPMKRWIASKTLLGDPVADNAGDLIFFPVVNPGTNKLNEGALRAVISGRGSQANIPTETKESSQATARRLLTRHFNANIAEPPGEQMSVWRGAVNGVAKLLGLTARDVSDSEILISNQLSHDELRAKLQALVDTLDGGGWVHFVREVFDDVVVYVARTSNPSEGAASGSIEKMYSRKFTIGENDEVALSDEAIEVREVREYVTLSDPSVNWRTDTIDTNTDMEDEPMKRDEVVKSLIENAATKFTESDAEWLNKLTEDQLAKLAPCTNKTEPPANDPPKPPAKPGTVVPAQPAEEEPETVESVISNVKDDEVRKIIESGVTMVENAKNALIKRLLKNKSNRFTDEQLRAKSIDELENLIALSGDDADYSGATGGPLAQEDPDQPSAMPSMIERIQNQRKAGASA